MQMGFFADAGPLQIFVSQHLIPSHYRVEITDDAAFESEENAPPIKAGAFVRVRIVGLKAEANQLVCVHPLPTPPLLHCHSGGIVSSSNAVAFYAECIIPTRH